MIQRLFARKSYVDDELTKSLQINGLEELHSTQVPESASDSACSDSQRRRKSLSGKDLTPVSGF